MRVGLSLISAASISDFLGPKHSPKRFDISELAEDLLFMPQHVFTLGVANFSVNFRILRSVVQLRPSHLDLGASFRAHVISNWNTYTSLRSAARPTCSAEFQVDNP